MEKPDTRARGREREIYAATLIGSAGNVLLVVLKFAAGIIGHSAAMIADAVHSLSDLATDAVVIVFVRISSKPQDKDHDFGHGKYETLATAVIGVALFFVGLGILWNGLTSIWAFLHGAPLSSPGTLALWAALLSIVVKELLYQYTVRVGRRLSSQAVVANAWHHRSDALSSVGTAIGIGGAILLGGKWAVLDPLAAVVVSVFIIRVAYKLVLPSVEELTEESLPESVEDQIITALLAFPEVSDPHNLRTRRVGNRVAVDVHVRMDGAMTVSRSHEITCAMERSLRGMLGDDSFISIHVEPKKKPGEKVPCLTLQA